MFAPDVIEAVKHHMNTDHTEDGLLICRTLGAQPAATAAEMIGMDEEGIEFSVSVDGQPVAVRIPWYEPIVERDDVRMQVVRMYRDACHQLGVSPKREESGQAHG